MELGAELPLRPRDRRHPAGGRRGGGGRPHSRGRRTPVPHRLSGRLRRWVAARCASSAASTSRHVVDDERAARRCGGWPRSSHPARNLRRLAGWAVRAWCRWDDGYHRVVAVEFHTRPAARGLPVTLDELRGGGVNGSPGWSLEDEPAAVDLPVRQRHPAGRPVPRTGRVLLAGDAAHVHFPGRWAGPQHRHAGRGQPRLEARRGVLARLGHPRNCSTSYHARTAPGRPAGVSQHPGPNWP